MEAARLYRDRPRLGARPLAGDEDDTEGLLLVNADKAGHVRHIDMPALQELAERLDCHVTILRMPGKYVHKGEALAGVTRPLSPKDGDSLRAAFTIGPGRSFDQDLHYGVVVLSEVASKALSAAINDPGTAIDVIRAGSRVLAEYHDPGAAQPEDGKAAPDYDRLYAPDLDAGRLHRELFLPIARHGADDPAVIETLLDNLDALAKLGGEAAAARVIARDARNRAARKKAGRGE